MDHKSRFRTRVIEGSSDDARARCTPELSRFLLNCPSGTIGNGKAIGAPTRALKLSGLNGGRRWRFCDDLGVGHGDNRVVPRAESRPARHVLRDSCPASVKTEDLARHLHQLPNRIGVLILEACSRGRWPPGVMSDRMNHHSSSLRIHRSDSSAEAGPRPGRRTDVPNKGIRHAEVFSSPLSLSRPVGGGLILHRSWGRPSGRGSEDQAGRSAVTWVT